MNNRDKQLPECLKCTPIIGCEVLASEACTYFNGVSNKVNFGKGELGAIILSNPKDSGVIISLNKLSCTNYSTSPIEVNVFADAIIRGKFNKSCNIAPANSSCIGRSDSQLDILDSESLLLKDGIKVFSKIIVPYGTSEGFPGGTVIMHPGAIRVYLFNTIDVNECARVAISYTWVEKQIK